MSRVLVIGCGGVAQVAIQKIAMVSEVFEEMMIASRTISKCDAVKAKIEATNSKTKVTTATVDADNVEELTALIKDYAPDLVLNVALPYQDLTIMDACLGLPAFTMLIQQTMSLKIQKIQSGELSTRSVARILVSQLTLITPGSGLTRRSLKTQVLQLFLEQASTQV